MAENKEKNGGIEIVKTDVIETELSAEESEKLDENEVGAKLEKIGEIEASAMKTVEIYPDAKKEKKHCLRDNPKKMPSVYSLISLLIFTSILLLPLFSQIKSKRKFLLPLTLYLSNH